MQSEITPLKSERRNQKSRAAKMAANVFGNPVTKMTLEAMLEYEGKEITRFDLAREAYHLKNAEQKAVNARAYVDNLKANFGNGVCTKCLIYNATGEPITFISSHDWYGRIGESPYPMEVANGQWAAFLHTKIPGATSGSVGAVVYRIKATDPHGKVDCMLAWCTAWGPWYENHCYAEMQIRKQDYFKDKIWNLMEKKLERSGLQHVETVEFYQATVSMGNDTTSAWEAILKVGNPY